MFKPEACLIKALLRTKIIGFDAVSQSHRLHAFRVRMLNAS